MFINLILTISKSCSNEIVYPLIKHVEYGNNTVNS